MRRLTITYREQFTRAEGPVNHITIARPGRVVEVQVALHYVRDGALFYRAANEPVGTEHMVPLDLLFHQSAGPEQET